MSQLTDAVKLIDKLVLEQLKGLGFVRKGRGGVLLSEIEADMYYWIGMPWALYRKEQYISLLINVGIHHRPLQTLSDQLFKQEAAGGWHPTAAQPLYKLMPPPPPDWSFWPTQDPDPEPLITEMVTAIREYGLPWSRQLTDLDKLAVAIRDYQVIDVAAYTLPALYLMKGDTAQALAVAEEYRTKRRNTAWWLERYDKFMQGLKTYIASH